MFVKARKVKFLDGVKLDVTFQDGKIIRYDMSKQFDKYPQLIELRNNRKLFLNGKIDQVGWAIIWNEDLDFDATSIYFGGEQVGFETPSLNDYFGSLINQAMSEKKITQSELARRSKINQADIWRLIKGEGNPTLAKIQKVLDALEINLVIKAK